MSSECIFGLVCLFFIHGDVFVDVFGAGYCVIQQIDEHRYYKPIGCHISD